jgi:hypothetical protein
MKDTDLLKLAIERLKPEELDQCFLRAFHRLPPPHREVIEDAGLEVMTRLDVTPEGALELVAHTAIYLNARAVVSTVETSRH